MTRITARRMQRAIDDTHHHVGWVLAEDGTRHARHAVFALLRDGHDVEAIAPNGTIEVVTEGRCDICRDSYLRVSFDYATFDDLDSLPRF